MNSGLVIKTNKPHESSEGSINGRLSIAMFCIVVKVSLYLLCRFYFILFFFNSTPAQEQLIVMWLSWMIKEEEYFER